MDSDSTATPQGDADRSAGTPARRLLVDAAPTVEVRLGANLGKPRQLVEAFSNRTRRLPTFAQVFRTYRRSIDGADERLRRLARLLNGRFVVANPQSSVALPSSTRDALMRMLDDLATLLPASAIELRLEEPLDFVIRHGVRGPSVTNLTAERSFSAHLDYVAHIVVRTEPAVDEATREVLRETVKHNHDQSVWFRIGLCMPDHDVLERMSPDTAHFYRWITGRLGGGSKDEYWHLDAWDQYTEAGRIGGVVVPEFLRLPPRAAKRAPVEESSPFQPVGYGASVWAPLTPSVERGVLIPPGFCFVDFEATVSIEATLADPFRPRMRTRL
jgi:hypothetical protein